MTFPAIPTAALELAASIICDEESYVAKPYYDDIGHCWSQGFGFCSLANGDPVTENSPLLTEAECQELLIAKLTAIYIPPILTDCGSPLTTGQLAALSSFVWNLGDGTLGESSIPRYAKSGAWSAVRAAMQLYVHDEHGSIVSDLVGRRYREGCILMGATFIPGKRTGAPILTPVKALVPHTTAHAKPLPPKATQLHARPALAAVRAVVSPAQSTAPDPADLLNAQELTSLSGA